MASDSENIWDDTLLIKAYDSSVKLANSEIAKRIASATNSSGRNSKPQENESEDFVPSNYNIGDYVRATYEDEIDYEAKIITIDRENGMCTIKYIGYDNEQEVALCELVPSWGKKARRSQFTKAKDDKKHRKKEKIDISSMPNHSIPPPPPIPPMLNELNEDSENISAMLMSWYMSGYYTGLYQGQKMAKSKLKYKQGNGMI